jgi:hypothetical protein
MEGQSCFGLRGRRAPAPGPRTLGLSLPPAAPRGPGPASSLHIRAFHMAAGQPASEGSWVLRTSLWLQDVAE